MTRARTVALSSPGGARQRNLHRQIEAIQKRPRQAIQIAQDLSRPAAGMYAAAIAGRTGVHGRHQLKTRRQANAGPNPRDVDFTRFQRLAQQIEHPPLKLRQLVKKQYAVMGQRDLAGARKGRCRQWRLAVLTLTLTRLVMAAVSIASLSVNGGSSPGNRLASMVFPVPGGPISNKLWPSAAAISSARRACCWPITSAKSLTADGASRVSVVGSAMIKEPLPCKKRHTCCRHPARHAWLPGSSAISSRLACGRIICRPSPAAPWAAGIAP